MDYRSTVTGPAKLSARSVYGRNSYNSITNHRVIAEGRAKTEQQYRVPGVIVAKDSSVARWVKRLFRLLKDPDLNETS
eukprot:3357479-Rhodomonas_salina.2